MTNQDRKIRNDEDPNTTQEQPSKIEEIDKRKEKNMKSKKMETTKKTQLVHKKIVIYIDNIGVKKRCS